MLDDLSNSPPETRIGYQLATNCPGLGLTERNHRGGRRVVQHVARSTCRKASGGVITSRA